MNLENIQLVAHSAIRIINKSGKIIYFDPFKLENKFSKDADYIFITHPHYDHFSPEDIIQIKNDNTIIIVPSELSEKCLNLGFSQNQIITVSVNKDYKVDNLSFKTVPAYNLNKDFHKKNFDWVGYVINIDNTIIYIAGDTDNITEIQNINCDIAFVPVGGTYTMTYKEAADLAKVIKPKLAIPIHYKTIVGTYEDAENFVKELDGKINSKILMK